jgi:D-3-phosphoglycerate dehydrogenase
MNIYLIEEKDKLGGSVAKLKPFGKVIPLTSGEKTINKYKQIFRDEEEKVIGIAPGITDWKFPVSVIRKIKNLKGICTKSSWAYYIDIDYCKKNNITVCNTPGANSQSVAEYAIWMMFSLVRKLPLQTQEEFEPKYNEIHQQIEVVGKTMGIVGLGNVGRRISKLGKGLGMKVIYWSPKSRDQNYSYKNLNYVLKNSDFIFNCIEVMDKTKGFFNKKKLSLIKKEAYFISVMGGMGWGAEDNDYLIKMINQGKLAGFAIEGEHEHSYKFPKIKKGVNVFIPGAYAWFTKEAAERSNQKWTESIIGIIKNKPINIVK